MEKQNIDQNIEQFLYIIIILIILVIISVSIIKNQKSQRKVKNNDIHEILLDKESSDNDTIQSEDSLLDLEQVNINLSQLALDNIARYERYTDNHQQITKQAIENINKHKNFQKMLITEQQPSSKTSNKENKPINKNLCKLGCGQIYTRGHSCPKRRN